MLKSPKRIKKEKINQLMKFVRKVGKEKNTGRDSNAKFFLTEKLNL
jgi:hypothetical protein